MKKKNNKKKKLALAAVLALTAAGAGTFAWITAQDQKINRVNSGVLSDGSVTIEEKWEPKPVIPGTEAVKEVRVNNSGSGSVFARVSFEEVLKAMASKGNITQRPKWYDPSKTGLKDDIPVISDGKKYLTDSYVDITSQVVGIPKDLPEGTEIVVYGSGIYTKDPVSQTIADKFEAAVLYKYADGKYQVMNATVDVTAREYDQPLSEWKYSIKDMTYEVYADGYKNTVVNWAESSLTGTTDEAMDAKTALLGTAGKRVDIDYDYTSSALGLDAIPTVSLASDASIPTTSNVNKAIQADKAFSQDDFAKQSAIEIQYGSDITTVNEFAKDKWVYNAEDGYFYFTSMIKSGTTTPALMDKLIFTEQAGKPAFSNVTYDLVVKVEGIQATKEALTDDAGWSMDADKPDTKIIIDKLIQAISAKD